MNQFGNNLQQKQTITIQTTKYAGLANYNVPEHIKPNQQGCRRQYENENGNMTRSNGKLSPDKLKSIILN
jgi:hypothetical protein